MANFQFNAQDHQPDLGAMGAVPAGWYDVSVDETDISATNSGTGSYIKARFNILNGDYAGQKIWHNFNVQNENDKAVEIGMGQLSALCHAINVLSFTQTEQLHGIPLKVRTKIEKGNGDHQDQSRITAFRDIAFEGATASPTKAGNATAPAQPATVPNFVAPQATAPQATQAPVNAPAQPWDNQPTASAPAQPAVTQAPAPAPAPAPQAMVKEYVMTASANGLSREDYLKANWTDEQLVEHGIMQIIEKPAQPAPAPAPQQAPSAPSAPTAPAPQQAQGTPTAPSAGADLPPWMQQ
ncbi:hypothetical protein [Vibrio phage vB_VibM_83AMN]|nr:hypothetical protein [Vibrio phage vB_VibM_83AMN]